MNFRIMLQMLKNDPLLARERKLFTYFFNNPSKLQQTMDEISARLEAQSQMGKS